MNIRAAVGATGVMLVCGAVIALWITNSKLVWYGAVGLLIGVFWTALYETFKMEDQDVS